MNFLVADLSSACNSDNNLRVLTVIENISRNPTKKPTTRNSEVRDRTESPTSPINSPSNSDHKYIRMSMYLYVSEVFTSDWLKLPTLAKCYFTRYIYIYPCVSIRCDQTLQFLQASRYTCDQDTSLYFLDRFFA